MLAGDIELTCYAVSQGIGDPFLPKKTMEGAVEQDGEKKKW